MSDRPSSTQNDPEQKSASDAWHMPETPGGWRVPKTAEETVGWTTPPAPEAESTGWRVPALPQELNEEPEGAGAWHLPNPDDTPFKPEDEIVIGDGAEAAVEETPAEEAPAEEAAPEETEAAAEAEPEAITEPEALPFDEVEATAPEQVETEAAEVSDESPLPFGPEVDTAPTPTMEHPDENALPFDVDAATDSAPEHEDALITPSLVVDEDEDDEDTFSMSELIALASLAEGQPKAAAPAEPAPVPPAAEAAPLDAAEYARRQLERLQAQEQQAAAGAPTTPEAQPSVSQPAADAATMDAAEYARRQLERLGQSPSPAPAAAQPAAQPAAQAPAQPAAPAPVLNPREAELAQKYTDTEDRVRGLRAQYRRGEISRDQLQGELRGLMVLDEAQNWWMMGVETDAWYKYDNGQWVQAAPPVLVKAREAQAASEAQYSSSSPALPNLPTSGQPTATVDIPLDEGQTIRTVVIDEDDYMPLPRAVPVRDPDFTLPGTAGVYIPPGPSSMEVTQPIGSQPTVPMNTLVQQGATVPSPAINYTPNANVIGAPIQVDEGAPPDYEIANVPSPTFQQAAKRKQQSTLRTVLIIAVVGFGLLFLLGACGIVAGIAYYSSLASPYQDEIAALANYQPQFQTARILDAAGNEIVELTSQEGGAREKIELRDMAPELIMAVVATENERYFDDPGWDPIAIGRAMIQNLASGSVQSGASTITQQIARNLILHDTTVSAERKIQEIVIASEIAQRYDKNFILQLYLNEVFFGNRSYGVEAASQFYFDKSAADLNLGEAAMLAGLIQAPATYDPVVNPQAAMERMDTVLERMRRVGCLQFQHEPYLGEPFCVTDDQIRLDSNGNIVGGTVLIDRAYLQITSFEPREYLVRYPHFVNFVQAQVEQAFGPEEMFRRGFTIHTTLVPSIQDAAQTSLERNVAAARSTGINTGAVLVTDPTTGAILAMVGSPDFNNEDIDGQVNNVLTWQQPGSSIKPVEYAASLEGATVNGAAQYWTPATIIWDVPTTYNTNPPYSPRNYDGRFHGPIALRYALQNSYNIPAVKALEFIGLDKFREVATRMGLRFLEDAQFGLPSALGANEVRLYDHVQAYGVFANGGNRVPLYAITSITDSDGNPIELPERAEPTPALSPQVVFLMDNILSDNEARSAAFGLNSGLSIPGYEGLVGAKTGTTNEARDLWTMGFTSNAVVGVWTGTVSNDPTTATTGSAAIPIFNEVMRAVIAVQQPQPFANPGGVVQMQVCADTGTVFDPNQNCANARNELFLQNQPPPPATQAFVQTAAVDTWTGFRANQFCTENVETRTFVNITDPSALQWLQTTPDGQAYAQSIGLPTEVEALPAQECSTNTPLPNIRLQGPQEGQQVQGLVQITGVVQAQNFNRYQLEIASINNPDAWTIIAGPVTTQQTAGAVLGQWDTTQLTNGVYKLRLAAFANDGGYVYRVVQVGVNNPLPTATPIPTVIPTQIIPPTTDFNLTPLPFDGQTVATAVPPPTLEVPGL